ncbi:tumor necrosis factor receptor superfamily member 23-like isoform X2 [Ammospiza nelsoni]|uniref:tumor necrosis factor receptor superfamily member 23-like isoform X2 n=1 Tax=Ammospiza caudacuta TaxID=2857398 RepID=UPI0027383619|nr:tumor necrosis factor receptor superfamily member 23-like isoform X2 [Ammospiza caudacuta]XP_059330368.1 tumor necrosis factor receptor superfamily member 23-like isoform X2 [Ammospiza nelsoni]
MSRESYGSAAGMNPAPSRNVPHLPICSYRTRCCPSLSPQRKNKSYKSGVVLLTMPRARANCGEREYSHQDHCCVFCEAGTFVADHCNTSHLQGKCDPCKEGKSFTAHANGLEHCLACRQCKEGQITLRPCTLTQNAECQCKPGYFCEDEGCEICRRISQEHLDGKEIMNSTDTMELGLTNQVKEAHDWFIPVLALAALVFLVVVIVVLVKKLKCDKAAVTVKDIEGCLVHKWLKYVKHPRFFVGLYPGQICSTSPIYRS